MTEKMETMNTPETTSAQAPPETSLATRPEQLALAAQYFAKELKIPFGYFEHARKVVVPLLMDPRRGLPPDAPLPTHSFDAVSVRMAAAMLHVEGMVSDAANREIRRRVRFALTATIPAFIVGFGVALWLT